MEGFDYAWGFGSGLPAALKKAGASFVVRYVGTSSKCLTNSEAVALHAAGIATGMVYETTGTTFTGGTAAGNVDGSAAKVAAAKLGAPTDSPIYFAIDTDTADYSTVKNYLAGCTAGCYPYPAKLYAGYHVIEAVGGSGHWQTYAWSGGLVSSHAGLYQYYNGVTVGGVQMDNDRTLSGGPTAQAGWLTYNAPVPAPKPAPGPIANTKDKLRLLGNSNAHAAAAVKYVKGQMTSGASGWKDLCAALVRNAYGISDSAWGNLTRTAAGAFHAVPSAQVHTWYNAPVGTAVCWTGGSTGAGHVAVADGLGNVYTNDFGPHGYIGDGRVRLVPISAISQHDPALKYAGWIELYLGTRIYN